MFFFSFLVVLTCLLLPVWQSNIAFGQGRNDNLSVFKVLSTRIIGDDNRLRIITIFNQKPHYRIMLLDNQPRLVIDIPKVEFLMPSKTVEMHGLVKELRYGLMNATQSRMVFTMKNAFSMERSDVEPINNDIWQLTVDIKTVPSKEFSKAVEQTRKFEQLRQTNPENFTPHQQVANANSKEIKQLKPFKIVIDAGHGGFDKGAIGISGVQEKDVTLGFAKALRNVLDKKRFQVFLTRDDDTYLRLSERVQIARSKGADLFISIHADFIHLPQIRGATVYTLSDKASDSVALVLAENENKSDLLGGLPTDEPPEVTDILIDLARRETGEFSSKFADNVISSFNSSNIKINTNPHRYAGFMVLKAPDIPSVLIELGYLSNKDDEALITDPKWQADMAHILSNAIEKYAQMRFK